MECYDYPLECFTHRDKVYLNSFRSSHLQRPAICSPSEDPGDCFQFISIIVNSWCQIFICWCDTQEPCKLIFHVPHDHRLRGCFYSGFSISHTYRDNVILPVEMLIDWERDWFEKQILLPESEFIVNRSTENSIFFGKPIIFVVMYWACGVFCMSRAQLGCFNILIHCMIMMMMMMMLTMMR